MPTTVTPRADGPGELARTRYVVGWASVPRQVRAEAAGLLRVGDAHAVLRSAGNTGHAVCGTHVDEVEMHRPFPAGRLTRSAELCESCLQRLDERTA